MSFYAATQPTAERIDVSNVPPAKFVTGSIIGDAVEPIADPTAPAEPVGDPTPSDDDLWLRRIGYWQERAEEAERALIRAEREVAEAQTALRRMKAQLDCAQENFHVTNQAYVKADAEVAELRADAERYRWLRRGPEVLGARWRMAMEKHCVPGQPITRELSDAAIDAALKEPKND